MEIALRAESETMKNLANESLKIITFLAQSQSNSLESEGHFTRDDNSSGSVLITLFNSMGENGDNQ